MPVQINEMIIRANIVEPGEQQGNAGQSKDTGDGGISLNKEELIRECAALVLEMINNKNQR